MFFNRDPFHSQLCCRLPSNFSRYRYTGLDKKIFIPRLLKINRDYQNQHCKITGILKITEILHNLEKKAINLIFIAHNIAHKVLAYNKNAYCLIFGKLYLKICIQKIQKNSEYILPDEYRLQFTRDVYKVLINCRLCDYVLIEFMINCGITFCE